jgi:GntR family transcriptional regulator
MKNNRLIDDETMLPKYYRLKKILRDAVSEMQPGSMLPSEAELCKQYDVSRTTIRKALTDLNQEGLIYSYQGKGTFVAPKKMQSNWVIQSGGFYADMKERGFQVRMQVLEHTLTLADHEIQTQLHLGEDKRVFKLVRLRFVDDMPFDTCTNYVPAGLFPKIEEEDFSQQSLYSLMRSKYGIVLDHGTRLLEADAATREEARLLQIQPHTPLLVMRSTMYDVRGFPVEHGIARQRSDFAQILIDVIPH